MTFHFHLFGHVWEKAGLGVYVGTGGITLGTANDARSLNNDCANTVIETVSSVDCKLDGTIILKAGSAEITFYGGFSSTEVKLNSQFVCTGKISSNTNAITTVSDDSRVNDGKHGTHF
jgi:hypothetical protein